MSTENVNHIYSQDKLVLTQKVSKAARRREKRDALQRAQQTAALMNIQTDKSNSLRSIEMKNLEKQLEARHLSLFEVPSDGDCLYQSIGHQLKIRDYPVHTLLEKINMSNEDSFGNIPTDQSIKQLVQILRHLASYYIRKNMNEFLPFLFNPNSGEPMSIADFDQYCDEIKKTSTWGGQIEIRALSAILQIPIEILQAEGVPLIIGEEFSGPPITVV
ncbi:OTU domain-containing protein isoform 1 [Schistosoma japonicum]|nr:OTU domain-containing protein isoform 1 [Schistosoma japonicum]